jgi:hypothetical protein
VAKRRRFVTRKLPYIPAYLKDIASKEPPVKTGGILEFKQSLPAVFFALHLNIFPYC